MQVKRFLRNLLCITVAALMITGLSACSSNKNPTDTSAVTQTTAPKTTLPSVGVLGENSFENDADLAGWIGRGEGNVSVTKSDKAAHTGTYSLLTENRALDWNGPGCTYPFEAGKTYAISAWVYQDSGSAKSIILSAEATVDGVPGYQNLNRAECKSGEWTKLSGTFRAGEKVEKTVVYFETLNATDLKFYIDDISVADKDSAEISKDLPSLSQTFADSFDIGCAVPLSAFSDPELVGLLKLQYNAYTHENELKPENLLDLDSCKAAAANGDETHPVLNFDKAIPLLDYAKENGFSVHGHVLVWFKQTPMEFFHEGYDLSKPVVSKEIMQQRLENYIAAVFDFVTKNYPGVIKTWDVVNEAISGDTGTLRLTKTEDAEEGDMWLEVIGPDYIEDAFTYARKYAPSDVLLFYNDFNIPYEPKQTGIYNLVKGLADKGLIDGVGFQGHYEIENPSIEQISKAIDRFADLGLRIRISELDIQAPGNSDEDMLKQAYRYAALLKLFSEKSDVIDTVTFWGISDATSWMAEKYPLLFNADMQPKYSFWALTDPSMLPPVAQKANAYGVSELSEENFALATRYAFGDNAFCALFTPENLTIRVMVADKTKDATDSVTVFLPDGPITVGRDKGTETDTGYTVDIVCPVAAKEGGKTDFDVLVNNAGSPAAWNDPKNGGEIRNLGTLSFVALAGAAKAVKGTPDMTLAEPDAKWESAPSFNVEQSKTKNANEDGTVQVSYKVMWDDKNLYILATVIDPFLDDSSTTPYEQDSVEVFLDEGNHKVGTYEADDGQYRVNFESSVSIDHGSVTPVTRTIFTDDGFIAEIAIPLTTAARAGQVMGFDLRYNNIDKNGKRLLLNYWDTTDTGWKDTSVFGLLVLS